MPSIAEQMRKEDDDKRKFLLSHKERKKKLRDAGMKRLSKLVEQTDYFEHDISDEEILLCFKKMLDPKKTQTQHSPNLSSTSATVNETTN